MEVGDWITLAAVLVALAIGAASIVATVVIRAKDINRERKKEALKEIANWAKKGYELCYDYQQSPELMTFSISERAKMLTEVSADGNAMCIAAEELGTEFRNIVEDANILLQEYWQVNAQWDKDYRQEYQNILENTFADLMRQVSHRRVELRL